MVSSPIMFTVLSTATNVISDLFVVLGGSLIQRLKKGRSRKAPAFSCSPAPDLREEKEDTKGSILPYFCMPVLRGK